MFLSIETWKNPEIIFKLATICGVPRKGVGGRQELIDREPFLKSIGAETKVLNLTLPEVSSSEIRKAIENGKSIDKLVPKQVENYILEKGLYLQKCYPILLKNGKNIGYVQAVLIDEGLEIGYHI